MKSEVKVNQEAILIIHCVVPTLLEHSVVYIQVPEIPPACMQLNDIFQVSWTLTDDDHIKIKQCGCISEGI